MNKIKVSDNEISLIYEDYKEIWVKSTTFEPKNFIKHDGYTYILKTIQQ